MTIESRTAIAALGDDADTNPSANPSFDSVLHARMSRRALLKGSMGMAAGTFFGSSLTACVDDTTSRRRPRARSSSSTSTAVAKSLADTVVVPAGYTATVLYRLGDPIAAGVADYANDGTDPGASYAQRARRSPRRHALLRPGRDRRVQRRRERPRPPRHEPRGDHARSFLHVNGPTIVSGARTVHDEVIKEFNVHGVSVIEVTKAGQPRSRTSATRPTTAASPRITEMTLSGPAARTPAMVTKYSPDGTRTRGTVNNCANGYTPWGTYLTCEENWAGYFRRITADRQSQAHRQGDGLVQPLRRRRHRPRALGDRDAADPADTTFARWNAEKLGASADGSDDYRNVANTYGWVVEIDPFAPTSTPKKRTALGRFAHEGAWPGPVVAGKPLVWYMGDDSRNEYIYKFVSTANWDPADANARPRRRRQVPRRRQALRREVQRRRHRHLARAALRRQRHHRRPTRRTRSPTRPTC